MGEEMGIPFRKKPPKSKLENDAPNSADGEPPFYKRAFKSAAKNLLYAQMYYKVAKTHEKVLVQVGMQAAFFIPGSSFAGLYLLYGDAKDYFAEKKTTKIAPVATNPCQKDFNGTVTKPVKCCKHLEVAPKSDDGHQDPNHISPVVSAPKN
jgi:hypothetical protein